MPSQYRHVTRCTRLLLEEALSAVRASFRVQDDDQRRPTQMIQLEQRILMSASPLAVAVEAPAPTTPDLNAPVESECGELQLNVAVASADPATEAAAAYSDKADVSETQKSVELVVIDPSADNHLKLLADLQQQTERRFEVLVLNPQRDGIVQITDVLTNLNDVSAIHLVSHGEDGELLLGTSVLSARNISRHAAELLSWQQAMTADADLLIYGCDLAATEAGIQLSESLQTLLGADVAASTDATGHAQYAGDWDLEYRLGDIETKVAFTEELQDAWKAKLASITVTTEADVVDGNTSSVANLLSNKGADGFISLREAILAINAGAGGDTIYLGAGRYELTMDGSGEDLAATGDLDILKSVTIVGANADDVTIDASTLTVVDRVLHIVSGTTSISGVTITGGQSTTGGAIETESAGGLNLTDVELTGNSAAGNGGAIFTRTATNLLRVTIADNVAGSNGGGLYFSGAGTASLTNVTFSANTGGMGGAYYNFNTTVTVTSSTIVGNSSGIAGAGGGAANNVRNTILDNFGANATVALTSFGNNIDSNGTASGLLNGVNSDQVGTAGMPISLNLSSLGDFGGQVRTHALLAGSAAIDSGKATSAAPTDARNYSSTDGRIDVGAYQAGGAALTRLYWTDETSGKIQSSDLNGSDVVDLKTGLSSPDELFVDSAGGKIYWSEAGNGAIRRMNLDGSFQEDVLTPLNFPRGFAIDVSNQKIYWAEDGVLANSIKRANLDGSGQETLASAGLISPDHVILDLQNGKIYWADQGTRAIERADLDGTNRETVIVADHAPLSVKVDAVNEKIYWTSFDLILGDDKIFMADLDVWTPTDIVSSGLQIPDNLALDPANGSIYWTDPGTQTISRADRDGSNPTVLPLGTLQRPKGLAIGASPATTTNSVPTADAGGPYTISEGSSLNLDASGSTDPDTDPLTYRWDLDNDGTFGEAREPVSETATLSWATLQSLGITGDGVYSMSLQVSDGRGGTTTDVFTLTVIDQTPTDLTFDGGTIDENSVNGTVVGTAHGVDPERDARISALLAANPDLSYSAVTGKFYEYVATSRRWTAARTDATTRALNGVNGQLVTVRSGTEQTIVHGIAAGTGATIWMGGSDQGAEGQWFWYDGLTADDQFWTGSGTGTAFNGAYQNWGSPREPNNRGNEDYLLMYASGPRNGTWDDGMITSFHAYIVEWNADEVLDQTDPLVYSLVDDAGARFSIDSDTGVVRVADDSRLDFELAASHNIVVRVTDSAGNDFQKTLTVSLNDLNDNESPVISSIADVTTPEDTSVGQIRFTVSDAESAAPGLTVTATSDNQSLIADADIVVHGKGSKRRLSFTPVKDASGGPATITVTVSDGTATTSTSFNVTLTPQNDAPVFKGPNSQILTVVGGGRIVQAPGLLSGASDADNDPLKIVILSGPSHGTLLTKPDGSFSYKVDDDYTGNDQFTYVVSDGTANSPVRKVILQIPSLATLNTVRTNQTVTSADAAVDSTDSSVKSDVASTKATVTAAATRPAEHRDANDDDLDYVPPPTLTTEDEDHKGVQALSAPVADSDQFQFQQSVSIALAPADRLSPNDGRDAGDADRSSEGSGHRLTTEVIDTEFLTGLSYEQYAELRETVHQLDQFKEHLDSEYQISDVTASSVVVAGTSLVIGSVVTAIRSGVLALGLLSQLPVWTLFDPLMVMDGVEGDEGDSLQDIVDRQNEKTDEQQT